VLSPVRPPNESSNVEVVSGVLGAEGAAKHGGRVGKTKSELLRHSGLGVGKVLP